MPVMTPADVLSMDMPRRIARWKKYSPPQAAQTATMIASSNNANDGVA
jgi:hypothetical protein